MGYLLLVLVLALLKLSINCWFPRTLLYQESPDYVKELIRKTRKLTDKPFGVGVVLAFPHKENVKAILEEKVAVLQLYWGECSKELVIEAHNAGVKVVPQVSNLFSLSFDC